MQWLVIVILLAADSAIAQAVSRDEQLPKSDFSQGTLLRLLQPEQKPARAEPKVEWNWGLIEFNLLNIKMSVGVREALPGSVPGTTSQTIDPFQLNHVEYATTSRSFAARRDYSRERLRIEKMERARARVAVNTE